MEGGSDLDVSCKPEQMEMIYKAMNEVVGIRDDWDAGFLLMMRAMVGVCSDKVDG